MRFAGAMNKKGKGHCWALMNMDIQEVSRKKKPVKYPKKSQRCKRKTGSEREKII